jgi:hypothetical protein
MDKRDGDEKTNGISAVLPKKFKTFTVEDWNSGKLEMLKRPLGVRDTVEGRLDELN